MLVLTRCPWSFPLKRFLKNLPFPAGHMSSAAGGFVKEFRHFSVRIVPVLKDNYSYLIACHATKLAGVVDVSEVNPVVAALTEHVHRTSSAAGTALSASHFAVLSTHKHWDHSGGNEAIAKAFPGLAIYGGAEEPIPGRTVALADTQSFSIGELRVDVMLTPCHTSGHVLYHVYHPTAKDDGALFTGDTLFVGGIGAFFEGNASMMISALDRISRLPDTTYIFPGHEYTVNFLKFAADVTKRTDATVNATLAHYQALRAQNLPTVPSTLATEKATNVFMRGVLHPDVMASLLSLSDKSRESVMQKLYDTCP